MAETLVGAGVGGMILAAAMMLNSAHLRLVKSGRQSNAATLCLQERVEQMRMADWRKLTDATYLQDTLFAAAAKSAAPLDGLSERITVSTYPDETAAQMLVVERRADGQRTTLVSGEGLATQRLAKVAFEVGWRGSDGRQRLRATTTLISNGGISRMNLPSIGPVGGAPPGSSSTDTSSTSSSSGTTGSSSTSSPAPARAPGRGRGNVGGKSGKN